MNFKEDNGSINDYVRKEVIIYLYKVSRNIYIFIIK